MKYSVARQLEIGQKWERFLDGQFGDHFHISPANRKQERIGIDRWFVNRETGKKYSIQYKADKTAATTGNAFIETVSVDNKGIPGWAYTCEADFILYFIVDVGPIYIMRPKDIRDKLSGWLREYQTRTIPNNRYNSVGLLVPLDVIEETAVQVVNI